MNQKCLFIAEIWPRFQLGGPAEVELGPSALDWADENRKGFQEYVGPGPQSCDRMLGARLQVRPVPSGSTFRDFTTPSSITMENLPEKGQGQLQQPEAGNGDGGGGRGTPQRTLSLLPLEPSIPKKGHQRVI